MTHPDATATVPYRIRFEECDPRGALRAAGYLRLAQDLAWIHSERRGYDRDWYADRAMTWLVRASELEILAPSAPGEIVSVRTQVVGGRRVWARRRTEIRAASDARPGLDAAAGIGHDDGPLLAWLHTDWVMIDERGRPMTVPPEFGERFHVPEGSFDPVRMPAVEPPAGTPSIELVARPRDIDPLGHVNNAVYVDWIDETLLALGFGAELQATPRHYRLEYLAATPPETRLTAQAWRADEAIHCRIVGPGGADHLRATLVR